MNTRGIVYIGTSPCDEECAQTGSRSYDWAQVQQLECKAYVQALRRVHGDPPEGVRLFIARMPHDFGSYYEVQCGYDSTDEVHLTYASHMENGLSTWQEAEMWAPVLYHPETGKPIDMLEDPTLWDRGADEYIRPRGTPI